MSEHTDECNCFGDSGLHASTHVPHGSDRPHCDLCGKPVPDSSRDVLSAVNEPCSPYVERAAASTRTEADARREQCLNTLERMAAKCEHWRDRATREGKTNTAVCEEQEAFALRTAIAALEREGELRTALKAYHDALDAPDEILRGAFSDAVADAQLEAKRILGGTHET